MEYFWCQGFFNSYILDKTKPSILKGEMYKLNLGSEAFPIYVRLTQKDISPKERKKLTATFAPCARIFERFVLTSAGGNLLEGHPPAGSLEMFLTICGRTKMTSLNNRYRNRKKPTDVLSFPLHHDLKAGGSKNLQRLCLGDIYICREVALAQAAKFQISYYEELCHLFVHGFPPLVGVRSRGFQECPKGNVPKGR